MSQDKIYNTIIIGAGPAGLIAGREMVADPIFVQA